MADRPLLIGQIAERMQVVGPHVTRQVQSLERRGLVHRVSAPHDRRAGLIEPTREGGRGGGSLRELAVVLRGDRGVDGRGTGRSGAVVAAAGGRCDGASGTVGGVGRAGSTCRLCGALHGRCRGRIPVCRMLSCRPRCPSSTRVSATRRTHPSCS
ncbi:MarR family transcriptional regulator [Streptomyces griseoluteus]